MENFTPHKIISTYAIRIPNGRALDIGAGIGADSYYLAKHLGFYVDAVDSKSKGMIHDQNKILSELKRQAISESLPIHVHEIDIRKFSLERNQYNLIIAINSLQFMKENVDTLAPLLMKALMPGGRIIISIVANIIPATDTVFPERAKAELMLNAEYICNLFSPLKVVRCTERQVNDPPHPGAEFPHTHTIVEFVGDKQK